MRFEGRREDLGLLEARPYSELHSLAVLDQYLAFLSPDAATFWTLLQLSALGFGLLRFIYQTCLVTALALVPQAGSQ